MDAQQQQHSEVLQAVFGNAASPIPVSPEVHQRRVRKPEAWLRRYLGDGIPMPVVGFVTDAVEQALRNLGVQTLIGPRGGRQWYLPPAKTRDNVSPVERFRTLDQEIQTQATTAKDNVTALLRRLYEMQALLSQRGEDKDCRPDGLPTWTRYFEDFKKKHGLQITLRTAQRAFRGMDGKPPAPAPKSKPLTLSERDRRRLVEAAVTGNEIVSAWEHGGNIAAAV